MKLNESETFFVYIKKTNKENIMFAFIKTLAKIYNNDNDRELDDFLLKYRPIKADSKLDTKYKGKARSQQLTNIIRKKRMVSDVDNMLAKLSVKSLNEETDDFTKRFDSWSCLSKKRKSIIK
ncbi:hypothetical protein BDAP_000064 [Binucleata daphniae]